MKREKNLSAISFEPYIPPSIPKDRIYAPSFQKDKLDQSPANSCKLK